jgi:hypothetical protein
MPPDKLTERALAAIRPSSKPAKHGDGAGLYLLVQPDGARWWRFRYRYAGKQNTLSCGAYPAVSLAQARARRDEFRALLSDGTDPSSHNKARRADLLNAQREQLAATRFLLDNNGALSVRLGQRQFLLSARETADLRAFLDATKAVKSKG